MIVRLTLETSNGIQKVIPTSTDFREMEATINQLRKMVRSNHQHYQIYYNIRSKV